ncbi:RNA recognition motif-containing protein [Xylographa opegraphella]|nr:RNA recognition motif-containing protein [Xylographa opegraphella]
MESRRKRRRLLTHGEAVLPATEQAGASTISDGVEDLHHKQNAPQSRSLFVRSLPSTATTESLTELFSQSYPLKHATVVLDPITKKSKGYGFITFADAEDAQQAREHFNGSTFEGRKIKVEVAEPRHREVENGGPSGRQKSQQTPAAIKAKADRQKERLESTKSPKLIVRNLPWSIKDSDQLALLFRSYGKVKHATLPKAKAGLSAGFGFVVLRGRKNAEKALAGVNGKEVDGRTLAVDWAVEKEEWETLQMGKEVDEKSDIEFDQLESSSDDESTVKSEDDEKDSLDLDGVPLSDAEHLDAGEDDDDKDFDSDDTDQDRPSGGKSQDNSTTLFVRNLPFTCTDEILQDHFKSFGAVRYARVVFDHSTGRSKGTGFVCMYNLDDTAACLRDSPRVESVSTQADRNHASRNAKKHSLLEDTHTDPLGRYTIEGRVLQISRAVNRDEASRLTTEGSSIRDARDKDKRRLYLLSEGTIHSNSPLYNTLSPSEVQMREDSARQRQALIKSNPSLHLSLTRLSIRNIPRSIRSKDLKALAREAVVGFAKDVKDAKRSPLSKEELSRGGDELKRAEKERKAKGKGIVKQAKVVFEGREGGKVAEESGAGRSRGYGFVEYASHRWALMGLRYLNGHAVKHTSELNPKNAVKEKSKRLIVEFAIENAQVVQRRQEREVKARERSKLVAERRASSDVPPTKKAISRNDIMARTRKGAKRNAGKPEVRKQDSLVERQSLVQNGSADPVLPDKQAKRQQIIGRKRMLRKARKITRA